MSEELDMQKAVSVYNKLINMLDTNDWNYEKIEDKLMIRSGIKGEDLPIEFIIRIKPEQQIIQYLSVLPVEMPEDKRIDGAIATCVANYGLVDGSFDYDISDGSIIFRLTSSYRESTIGDDLFEYMIYVSSGTIDDYNDKFFMLAKGMMTLQQFIEKENR